MTKKKRSLRNEKLRVNRASETEEQRKERLRIEDKTNHEKRLSIVSRAPDSLRESLVHYYSRTVCSSSPG